MPISPTSLITTAAPAMAGWRTSLDSKVVLPLPRKPVISVTGMRPARGSRVNTVFCGGLRGSACVCGLQNEALTLTCRGSDVEFQHVQPAREAVHGVDDAPLIDKDVVELDGAGW